MIACEGRCGRCCRARSGPAAQAAGRPSKGPLLGWSPFVAMMLLSGVLLLCGSLLALLWAYEVNRRVPMPRWATFELIWEMLLACTIGGAMVGLLLILKYALRVDGPASVDAVEAAASLVAVATTVLLGLRLLRPLKRLRAIDGGRDERPGPTGASPQAQPKRMPRKAA